MKDAFGVEDVSKKLGAEKIASLMPKKEAGLATRLRLRRTRPALKPSDKSAASGNQAAYDAQMAVRQRAAASRRRKFVAGTAGLAAGSGLGVLGVDAAAKKLKKN